MQPIADVIWSTASKLVERVTSIEKPQDAERLLLRCRCGGSAGSGGDRSSLALGASPRGLSPQPPQSPAPLPSSTSPLPPKHTMVSPASPVATAVPPPPPPPPLAVRSTSSHATYGLLNTKSAYLTVLHANIVAQLLYVFISQSQNYRANISSGKAIHECLVDAELKYVSKICEGFMNKEQTVK